MLILFLFEETVMLVSNFHPMNLVKRSEIGSFTVGRVGRLLFAFPKTH